MNNLNSDIHSIASCHLSLLTVLAIGTLDQTHLVAVHALERDKLGGKVIPMH